MQNAIFFCIFLKKVLNLWSSNLVHMMSLIQPWCGYDIGPQKSKVKVTGTENVLVWVALFFAVSFSALKMLVGVTGRVSSL